MKKILILTLLSVAMVSCAKTAAPTTDDTANTQTPTEQTTDTPAVTE